MLACILFQKKDCTHQNHRTFKVWNFSKAQLRFQRLFPLLPATIVQPVSGKSIRSNITKSCETDTRQHNGRTAGHISVLKAVELHLLKQATRSLLAPASLQLVLQLLENPLHYLQLPHLQHSPMIPRNHHPAVISVQGWPSNWLFFTLTSHPPESVLKIFKFLVKCQQPISITWISTCAVHDQHFETKLLWASPCRHATSPLEPPQIGPRPQRCQAANPQFLHLEGKAANP